MLVMRPLCQPNVFCVLATTESNAKLLQVNIYLSPMVASAAVHSKVLVLLLIRCYCCSNCMWDEGL